MTRLLNLTSFRSVRSRLLALMACIVIPLAVLSIILASANYQTVVKEIELSQVQTLSNFAVRSRIWFRGSLQTLLATVIGVQADRDNVDQCESIFRATLAGLSGFQAISVMRPGKRNCHASLIPDVNTSELNNLATQQKTLPFVQQWIGPGLALARYDAVRVQGVVYLLIYARSADPQGLQWEAILLADAALLDQAFEVGSVDGVTVIALVNRGKKVVVARNMGESDTEWLPREERAEATISRWEDVSADGTRHIFASQIVAEPDLYVLMRSDKVTLNAALIQLLILSLTPLLALAILFVTYAKAVQSNITGWISGIERAANSRQLDPEGAALVPLDPAMPQDIRSVAEAFNGMVEAARKKEFELLGMVASNQFLVRELHHRVKNNLQVIQSYLALSRRQQKGPGSIHLAETEAKVQVLSAAYRLGLTDGGMQLVPVREFVDELVKTLSNSMRRPSQLIKTETGSDAALIVDRIIPFGLALVEAVIAALAADSAASVSVHVNLGNGNEMLFQVSTSGAPLTDMPSAKIMAGLAAQLGATQLDPDRGEILRWTFEI